MFKNEINLILCLKKRYKIFVRILYIFYTFGQQTIVRLYHFIIYFTIYT